MAYNDPGTPSYSAPPPDPRASEGRTDNYGWQGQAPSSPQQPYQQPYQPYGQPAQGSYYAGPMASATSGYAIASLVCSLLGYIGVFGIGPLLGIIFGHMAIREIDRSNGVLQGRGLAQAGLILGYIALGLVVLAIVFFALILIVGVGATAIPSN